MSIDDLINGALNDRGGMLDGGNLFAVVGDAQSQEMFILNLQDFLAENMVHFVNSTYTGTVLLGVYSNEEDARDCIDSIRETKKPAPRFTLEKDWYVILGKVVENELFILPITDYIVGYLHLFLHKAPTEIVVLNICDQKEAAEDGIDIIRLYIKEK